MEQEHALRRLGVRRNRRGEAQQRCCNQSCAHGRHFLLPGPGCCARRARTRIAPRGPAFFSRRTPERARPQQVTIIMTVWRLVSVLAATCLLAEPTVAQVLEPTTGAAQPASGLEEVMVTAQKRPENIQ